MKKRFKFLLAKERKNKIIQFISWIGFIVLFMSLLININTLNNSKNEINNLVINSSQVSIEQPINQIDKNFLSNNKINNSKFNNKDYENFFNSLKTDSDKRFERFMNIFTCILIPSLIILIQISLWKIYKKIGKPGWISLMPIYNIYVLIKSITKKNYLVVFWIVIIIEYILNIICTNKMFQVFYEQSINNYYPNIYYFEFFRVGLMMLSYIIFAIIFSSKLSKAFDKSGWFTFGLVYCPFIFIPILAFDKSKYIDKTNNIEINKSK